MRQTVLTAGVLLFICATGALSFADIYKYVDENGVVHFTNMPKGAAYTKVITEAAPERAGNYDGIIKRKSIKYNINPSLIRAIIKAESNWNARAVSRKGAVGLMQLMPGTAREMDIRNPFDPEENIEGGTRYLRYLLNKFNGNLDLALAAYNAGPSRVEESGGIPQIPETKQYIRNVTSISGRHKNSRDDRIYRVKLENGTILYTNTPSAYEKR